MFPSVLHSRAALATQVRHVPNISGHPCEVTRHAEACATASDHLQLPDPAGFRVAHHFRSQAHRTCAQPTKLNPDAPATAPALHTTPHTMRRPARSYSALSLTDRIAWPSCHFGLAFSRRCHPSPPSIAPPISPSLRIHTHTLSLSPHPRCSLPACSPSHRNGRR